MESKDELKEIYIKNHTRYYFDDIIRFWDRVIDFRDILLDEKLYKENNLSKKQFMKISYKTSMGTKPLVLFEKQWIY